MDTGKLPVSRVEILGTAIGLLEDQLEDHYLII